MKKSTKIWLLIAVAGIIAIASFFFGWTRNVVVVPGTAVKATQKAINDADAAVNATEAAAVSARKAADSTKATSVAAEKSARDAAESAKDSAAVSVAR